jgi:F0F1-type ATP synthase membrane subunit b/b'
MEIALARKTDAAKVTSTRARLVKFAQPINTNHHRPMNKRQIAIAAAIITALTPALASAAEQPESSGSWFTLGLFVINFSLFVALLVYYAVAPVRKYMADRGDTIRQSLERAARAFSEAQDLANKAAAKIARLEAELEELKSEIEAETGYQVARVRDVARANAERMKKDSVLTSAALAEAAQRRVRARLADTAAALARDLIARSFQPADQGRLVDGFMERLAQERGR